MEGMSVCQDLAIYIYQCQCQDCLLQKTFKEGSTTESTIAWEREREKELQNTQTLINTYSLWTGYMMIDVHEQRETVGERPTTDHFVDDIIITHQVIDISETALCNQT